MKYISIITGSDLRFVMGVNYYIKSFIECNNFFTNVECNRVYAGAQMLKTDEGELMPIDKGRDSADYKLMNFIRKILRKLLTSRFYPFALLKFKLNERSVSRRSVTRFFLDDARCDYIIFQELACADYYFKHCKSYAKTNGIKTMLVIHSENDHGNMMLDCFHGYGRKDMERRFKIMRNYVYQHIDKVMYISQKAYNESILHVNKKAIVYNGSPNVDYEFIETKHDIIQLVCVGSMVGRKGQDKIIEAFHLMDEKLRKNFHVTFVGDGAERPKLQESVRNFGLEKHVSFLGRRNDVANILKDMDVFIMPSTVEGLPMSAIEALRAGLLLILTDTGGNAELCSNDCGLLCTREPENILSTVLTVKDRNLISMKQKVRCRNYFLKNFSLEVMAQNYEQILLKEM